LKKFVNGLSFVFRERCRNLARPLFDRVKMYWIIKCSNRKLSQLLQAFYWNDDPVSILIFVKGVAVRSLFPLLRALTTSLIAQFVSFRGFVGGSTDFVAVPVNTHAVSHFLVVDYMETASSMLFEDLLNCEPSAVVK